MVVTAEPQALADPLAVRASTAQVVAQARHVRIVPEAAAALAERWAAEGVQPSPWTSQYHFFDGSHRSANWLLALDAVNYCFWAENPSERWVMEYKGQRLNGYWALAACLTRAVEEGVRLWDAKVLAELSQGDVYRMFRGCVPGVVIPLITDRLTGFREVGQGLLDKYQGQALNLIEHAKGSGALLVALAARDFPMYNDAALYNGQEIYFYKRAQLLVSDLWGAFGGEGLGAFHDMECLTAFADYKVPQILRELGVLVYDTELAAKVDARRLIPAGSVEEVEIRAAMVQAVELVRDELARRGRHITAFQVDWLLWQQSQSLAMPRSYHLTRTIYY